MKTEINHKWFYSQTPEEIWMYLTETELIAQWIMPNDFKLLLGHHFTFRTNPIPSLNLDGIFHCKILEIVPFKKLVYSWKGGPGNDETIFDTIVEWTLEKKDNGTELYLLHTGFKEENVSILTGMTEGWLKKMEKVENLLNEK
ncbi:SRPBCC family protein [Flavobacterium sp. N2038]|jgi:uncharacterized protein YndB with AHSA1/START domain|uniref:SRPBCC family protein n=1 Tax=Flavobacterium sp. N2038 TaxID=2986829 RepID=UPI0022245DC5|nr:SRPBCC domain-containing protein [Flavobacterium sp. N2038]